MTTAQAIEFLSTESLDSFHTEELARLQANTSKVRLKCKSASYPMLIEGNISKFEGDFWLVSAKSMTQVKLDISNIKFIKEIGANKYGIQLEREI